jgi:hypothetical protein
VAEGHKALVILWGVSGVLLERYQINTTETPSAAASTQK